MKALTTILFVCLFSGMAYTQETPEESKEKEKSEQVDQKMDDAQEKQSKGNNKDAAQSMDDAAKKMKEMARWENYRLLHRTGALEDKPEVITEEMDIQTIIFNTLRKKKTMSFQELAGRTNIKDSSLRGYLMHLLNAKRVKTQ